VLTILQDVRYGLAYWSAEGTTPVAIISETVARRYWPHSNPVGSHLTVSERVNSGQSAGEAQPPEIVGVVKDVRNDDL
jgi:hypothetical protein